MLISRKAINPQTLNHNVFTDFVYVANQFLIFMAKLSLLMYLMFNSRNIKSVTDFFANGNKFIIYIYL